MQTEGLPQRVQKFPGLSKSDQLKIQLRQFKTDHFGVLSLKNKEQPYEVKR